MIADQGKTYAQILNSKVHWIFTSEELPEWNEEQCPAVDITDMTPQPQVGWSYDGDVFSEPAP